MMFHRLEDELCLYFSFLSLWHVCMLFVYTHSTEIYCTCCYVFIANSTSNCVSSDSFENSTIILISTPFLPWSWYPNNFYSNVGITRRHVRCFFNAVCFTGFWKIRGWPVWWRSHDGSIVDSQTFKLGRFYCDLWWHFSLHMNLPK